MEVAYITQRERGRVEAEHRYALIKSLPIELLWDVSEAMLLTAARFRSTYRLSFADSLIAAVALEQQAVLVHKDPEFDQLAADLQLEALLYR